MKENVLTYNMVNELGLNKVSVITADMLDGYTSIGYAAFTGCRSLTSIEIPNSVKSIGYDAFTGCMRLTSVHTSDIAAWCAISFDSYLANPLYYAHNLYLNGELVTDLVIPNSVTSITERAFAHCSSLTSVTIPNGVTSIGGSAFDGCSSLTYVTIDNSITSIGDYAFFYCNSLTSLTIGNSLTSVGNNAFHGCSGLTTVQFKNDIKEVGVQTFFGCNSLTSVTIGDKTYEKQVIKDGKCKAYKAFKADMTCNGFQYEEGKIYELDGEPKLCNKGFHACLNLFDVFNHYHGKIGQDIVLYEVELEGVADERSEFDSKVVAKKIKIGKRIL